MQLSQRYGKRLGLKRHGLCKEKYGVMRLPNCGMNSPCGLRIAVDCPFNSPASLIEVRGGTREFDDATLAVSRLENLQVYFAEM